MTKEEIAERRREARLMKRRNVGAEELVPVKILANRIEREHRMLSRVVHLLMQGGARWGTRSRDDDIELDELTQAILKRERLDVNREREIRCAKKKKDAANGGAS